MTEKKYQEWLSDQLDEKRDQIKKRENELEILDMAQHLLEENTPK